VARHAAKFCRCDLHASRSAAELTAQARELAERGADRLLVVGGDGTLHHAIQGLAGSECTLGIIPGGTGNDLAHALELPCATEQAVRIALGRGSRLIDLGRVGEHYFAGVLGMGIDAAVAHRVNATRAPRGPWLYPAVALHCLATYRPGRISIRAPDFEFDGSPMLAVVANSPRFGAGMQVAPMARMDDGKLDLIVVDAPNRLTLGRLLLQVYRGAHIRHPAVRSVRVERVRFVAEEPPHWVADGESLELTERSVEIEVAPDQLKVACEVGYNPVPLTASECFVPT